MSNRRKLDLDASRRARAEVENERPELTLAGKTFVLPSRLPAAVVVGLAEAQRGRLAGFERAVRALFGDDAETVIELGLEAEELEQIAGLYGGDEEDGPGNS